MDGAIVVDRDCTRILRAAVQLMPDPAIPTEESGTRHRTADRVAQADRLPGHLGQPVDAASSRCTSAASATCSRTPPQILSRANQALATLERYKLRLDEVSGTLSALEIEDLVTVRDVCRGRPAARDGAPHRRRDRGLRRRARHRRPAALPAARRADRRRRPRPRAGRPRLPAPAVGRKPRTVPERARPTSTPSTRRAARPRARSPGRSGYGGGDEPRRRGQPARLPAAGQGAAAARPRSSTGWSTTSAACRSCSRPASTTCRPSTASARARARTVREGLSRLAESSILERYV